MDNHVPLQIAERKHRTTRLLQADRFSLKRSLLILLGLFSLPIFIILVLPESKLLLFNIFSERNPEAVIRVLIVFYSMFSICAISLMIAGIEILKGSWKVNRKRIYPVPGMKVVNDTWIVRNRLAILLSYAGFSTGLLFILAGCFLPYYFHHLLIDLLSPVIA